MCIYKWMKIKISKLPFITFLKKHQVYLLHCICDLAPYIFKNIHGTKPQMEVTVRHVMSIRSKTSAYGNGNIGTQSHFLIRTTFSLYKYSQSLALPTKEIPLYLKISSMYFQYVIEQAARVKIDSDSLRCRHGP